MNGDVGIYTWLENPKAAREMTEHKNGIRDLTTSIITNRSIRRLSFVSVARVNHYVIIAKIALRNGIVRRCRWLYFSAVRI